MNPASHTDREAIVRVRALSIVLLLLALVVPAVSFAPAAAAGVITGCPDGTSPATIAGQLVCMDMNGSVEGYLSASGKFSATQYGASMPRPLTQPSSVLAAEEGAGGTASERAALAGAIGDVGEAGRVTLGARVATLCAGGGAPGCFITAAYTGYQIGSGIDHMLCGFGVSVTCMPKGCSFLSIFTGCHQQNDATKPLLVPNGDVGVDPAGWSPPVNGLSYTGSYGGVSLTATDVGLGDIAGITATGTNQSWTDNYSFTVTAETGNPRLSYVLRFVCNVSGTLRGSGPGTLATPFLSSVGGYSGTFAAQASICGPYTVDHVNLESLTQGTAPQNGTVTDSSCVSGCFKVIATWYPVGNAKRPQFDANPDRNLVTEVVCTDSSGANTTLDSPLSATFQESGDATTYPAYPDAPSCPAGTTLTSVAVNELGAGVPTKTLWGATIPNAVKTWQQNYPQCSDGKCQLGLWKINGSDHLNCWLNEADCSQWFADPSKTDDYQCTYGLGGASTYDATQVVDLSECNVLAPTFDPAKQAKDQPYADPSTGADPDPGMQDNPGTDPGTDPSAGLPGADGQSCWPSGWASVFNPLDWVLDPIKCALTWAFVPDSSTITDLKTQVGTALDSSGLGPWFDAIGGFFSLSDNSGCDGPEVTFPLSQFHGGSDLQLHPVSACTDPLRTLATISHAVSTVIILVGGGLACLNALTAAFGYRGDSTGAAVAS